MNTFLHTVGKNNEIEIKIEVIKMTINEIRELIPGATIMRNDVIYMSLDADDDYRYDVTIAFTLKESGIMRIHGFCSDLKIQIPRLLVTASMRNSKESSMVCFSGVRWGLAMSTASE